MPCYLITGKLFSLDKVPTNGCLRGAAAICSPKYRRGRFGEGRSEVFPAGLSNASRVNLTLNDSRLRPQEHLTRHLLWALMDQ